ncbi:hypothetical protein [Knoellia sp. LjRoot47]|uniref:hypothetical protein n=1 Tax=Knoellia sp. LjRoot47 TaxID=3342330 RepID=UPI003ECCB6B5
MAPAADTQSNTEIDDEDLMTAMTIVPGTPGAATPWDDLHAMWAAAPTSWDWAFGDAALIALAGSAWRANRLLRRAKRVPSGASVVYRGVRITGRPDGTHALSRHGHLPLVIEHVAYNVDGRRRTACIWPDSDLYA